VEETKFQHMESGVQREQHTGSYEITVHKELKTGHRTHQENQRFQNEHSIYAGTHIASRVALGMDTENIYS
jgi:hypothetical protein